MKARRFIRVAVAQMCSVNDKVENLKVARSLCAEARSRGCHFIALPENTPFLGTSRKESLAAAESIDGPCLGEYKSLAKEFGISISIAGFKERIGDGDRGTVATTADAVGTDHAKEGGGKEKGLDGREEMTSILSSSRDLSSSSTDDEKIYNTHAVIKPDGSIAALYRKIHLFDCPKVKMEESRFTKAGSSLVLYEPADSSSPLLGLSLGLTTCYDLRFPNMYQELRDAGANVLLVPSAFTVTTGLAHWRPLLRARAIETQCYVIAAAQEGRHHAKRCVQFDGDN